MQDYAWKAMHDYELHNEDFVVYCIFVDSQWKDLANFLSQNANWQLRRDEGFDPVTTGFTDWKTFEMAISCYPSLQSVQTSNLEFGMARYVVLYDNEPFVGDILAFLKKPF